jgi:hypothetical protein
VPEKVAVTPARPPISVASSKEFDPLSARKAAESNDSQQKVMSSFGLQNDGELPMLSMFVIAH